MVKIKNCWVLVILLMSVFTLQAQTEKERKLGDFVIAVIGDQPMLRSEFEQELAQLVDAGQVLTPELKCIVFEEILQRKLLVHQAELDSLPISNEQIEDDLNRRLGYFAAQMGGEKKLEEYLGKSLMEYKKEMRPKLKQQTLAKSMESKIFENLKVSPVDVQNYFNSIPQDSIPLIDAEFEVAQLVIKPEPSDIAKQYAYEQITKIRSDIIEKNLNFGSEAKKKSEDLGTAIKGGSLGEFGRGDMVPEFERAAYKLQKDSISPIIETQFGYHIIQLVERRGERVEARHILIRPKLTSYEYKIASELADSLLLVSRKEPLVWCELVKKFSNDDQSKGNCGFFVDPATAASKVALIQLEKDVVQGISSLKAGEFSEPKVFEMRDGTRAVRILYLKNEIPPHKANLKDDYTKLQLAASEQKREEVMQKWVQKKIENTYVRINPDYLDCEFVAKWMEMANKKASK